MPELPEVETTRRGLSACLTGETVHRVWVRNPSLRWPVSPVMAAELTGQRVESVERRAKYLLVRTRRGALVLHLGMSGSLQILPLDAPLHAHDHVLWCFGGELSVRLRDHRRFGAVIWTRADPHAHPLLRALGPEPLDDEFCGRTLHERARGRKAPVKSFLMDGRVVAGVGNIYATEALHRSGIHPARPAGRVAPGRYDALATHLREVLREAIERGGTTLRDFVAADGSHGRYLTHLDAYGRGGEPCKRCGQPLRNRVIAQRSTVYCARCQR